MRGKATHFIHGLLVVAFACGIVCLAPAIATATDPVTIAVEVTGAAAPGATVTAKATVTINDGSTVTGIAWSQLGGVEATLAGIDTDTVTLGLGSRAAYRDHLAYVLAEAPISEEQMPPNVPPGEFVGGLQNRYQVMASSPHALDEAGAVALEVAVTTTSGTYHKEVEVATALPWTMATGLRNVPVLVPVILHGKAQDSYAWTLTAPAGSAATLLDPTSQNPEFTPDVPGTYQLTVTDLATGNPVTVTISAGLWRGMVVGQDSSGRPQTDTACRLCHMTNTPLDQFTPWAQTGHAEIFSQNVNNPAGHYSASCLSCHTVGFDTSVANSGIDDAPDYQAMIDSGKVSHGATTNWTDILAQFPQAAKRANIQCENCHGPQDSNAHFAQTGARTTLSSDLCGTCHGEPTRHGRFQQWQLSGHANYELAGEEGMNGGCTKCHTANGYLAWLPVLTGEVAGDPNANVQVTWTQNDVHPQTCQTCHDPHAIGTTSGNAATNATVRISGNTPMLMSGFAATDVGRGAICMTCHNGRRGLRNDSNFSLSDASRAPHLGPQSDILMGQNLYLVATGTRSNHSMIEDSCVTCHMESTPPPDALSNNHNGTNHTFYARADICSKCHSTITTESVQAEVETKLEELKGAIEHAILGVMAAQINLGKKIDVGGLATITSMSQVAGIQFAESHGRQGIIVSLTDGTTLAAVAMNSVKAVPPTGAGVDLYTLANPNLAKAGWNYSMVEADKSKGVHNPTFVKGALEVSLFAVENLPKTEAVGGGPGNGAGAVACTTPYVYWAELAAHLPGVAGSQWRTDLFARNLSASPSNVTFVLHTETGEFQASGVVPAAGQAAFEDLVGQLHLTGKGAVEICSEMPLRVAGRTYNKAENGTFGQFIDGHIADFGLVANQAADLIGLRQESGKFRTNISVTNGGTAEATVAVTLFDAAGAQLNSFNLTIPAGQTIQDLEPFKERAAKPNLGWGFATVKVVSGSNVRASASVIDMVTNDPTTIPAKW